MTLKIEKDSDGRKSISLERSAKIGTSRRTQGTTARRSAADRIRFGRSTLVAVEAVRFLDACEVTGIELFHCLAYVREWMLREKDAEQ